MSWGVYEITSSEGGVRLINGIAHYSVCRHLHKREKPLSPGCGHANVINLFNQTFRIYIPLQHRPVTPGWRVSRTVFMYQSRPKFLQLTRTPVEFYVNLWVLMHLYICKSLLNTLGRTVEQLAGCLAKVKVSS